LHALVWPRAAETSTAEAAAAAAAAMEMASSLVHAASCDRCCRAPYLQLNKQVALLNCFARFAAFFAVLMYRRVEPAAEKHSFSKHS